MTRKSITEISLLASLFGMFSGGIFSFSRPLIEIFVIVAVAGIIFFVVAYFFQSFIYSGDLKKEELKEDDEIRIMQNELNRLVEMKKASVEKRAGKIYPEKTGTETEKKGKNIDMQAGDSDDDIRKELFGRGK